jgi:hypothetical protein
LHNIDRTQLTKELPLWAPALSENWRGDASVTAAAIARAIGTPVEDTSSPELVALAFAAGVRAGELDLGPRHYALIHHAGQTVNAVSEIWRTVQASNRGFRGASDVRKRAMALMLVASLKLPAARFHDQTDTLAAATTEYLRTLRKILDVCELTPEIDKAQLVALNEVYSGALARTFADMVAAFSDKRAQTVTFPKRHSELTRVLDRIGDDLGRLSFAFETLVEFCLDEMPARVRRILER